MPYEAVVLQKLLIALGLLPINLFLSFHLFDLIEKRVLHFGKKYGLSGFALTNVVVFMLIWGALPFGQDADPHQSLAMQERAKRLQQEPQQQQARTWAPDTSVSASMPLEIR